MTGRAILLGIVVCSKIHLLAPFLEKILFPPRPLNSSSLGQPNEFQDTIEHRFSGVIPRRYVMFPFKIVLMLFQITDLLPICLRLSAIMAATYLNILSDSRFSAILF